MNVRGLDDGGFGEFVGNRSGKLATQLGQAGSNAGYRPWEVESLLVALSATSAGRLLYR